MRPIFVLWKSRAPYLAFRCLTFLFLSSLGGVLWCLAFLIDVEIDLVKIGLSRLAAVLLTSSPAFLPAFIILDILVLVLVLVLLKRVKVSSEAAAKTPGNAMSNYILTDTFIVYEGPRRHPEDMTVILVLILAAQLQFITWTAVTSPMALVLLDAAEDSEDTEVSDVEQRQRGHYHWSSFIYLVLSFLAVCCSVVLDILCRIVVLALILGTIIKHTVQTLTKDKAGHLSEPDDEEADITLIEEDVSLAKDRESAHLPLPFAFRPPSRLSSLRCLYRECEERLGTRPPALLPMVRGGCPTHITTPPVPTPLNASASAFVPKDRAAAPVPVVDEDAYCPGLSTSIWASSSPPVLVKKEIVFRRAPASFWSPGGCAIPIVPPSAA
ncbi:hypothetical protein B0H19DRAFT_1066343 [Mycena capillaripes]|nr:hypothetical protein B0H19DRAFT_1066343 [Mycena capillaripes]